MFLLPLLRAASRRYVELCFQARLIKVVFATETLAVGVNMPARTVVFTQLDKPDDLGSGHRPLRPDEFWQMVRAQCLDNWGCRLVFVSGRNSIRATRRF